MRLLPALLVATLLGSWLPGQQYSAPDSVERLVDLWSLARLTPGVTCRQFASTDPTGQGHDHGHFLERDGNRVVLARMDGPGVIARIWSANAAGRLRVFFDGEATPRIDGPFQDLFTGKLPPFVEPIATRKSGGWISYFPIPYAKSCRVEVAELPDPAALYYQVQYLTYPAGTALRTFTRELPDAERRALRSVLRLWRTPGEAPIASEPTDRELKVDASIPAGQTRELFRIGEPGTVISLRIASRRSGGEVLRGLLLSIAWDGSAPAVLAPVGDLFGVGFGGTAYRGLVLGWDDGRGGYCHLPMPFRKEARLSIRNATGSEQAVTVELRVRPGPPAADLGTLHAEFRSVDRVGSALYEFARVEGPGKWVGITQTLQGVGDLWYLEGNEELTVDEQARPAIVGTGTEDFYNGGWYWDQGTFALPLHGLGVKAEWTTNRTTPWRMCVPDAVPFQKSFLARIEHGSRNQVLDAAYASVAFWYGAPRAVRSVPDQELQLPRQWVFRPKGWTTARELPWQAGAEPQWQTWEALTASHRGLDRPLFQAFPRSHVEQDQPAVDARVAWLDASKGPRTVSARITVPCADRYALELRCAGAREGGELQVFLDGKPAGTVSCAARAAGPLPEVALPPLGLAAGEHDLEFTLPGGVAGIWAVRLRHASPFVKSFWVGPPLPVTRERSVAEDEAPERAALAPDFAPAAAGWRQVVAEGDVVDLNRHVSAQAPVVGYLMTFVHVPAARTVRALLGSDDGVRVWLNGQQVFTKAIHRHMTVDEDAIELPLVAGWNRVLVKVKNDDGGYAMSLRFLDADGTLRTGTETDAGGGK